ncbi:DUF2141 domain-containing protein [Geminicoccus harenae]|uniref:DUF2141 domain-containing protein n=1 Tax=Geminicoccus harenae TaxID=2498453 RepID=UPI001CC2705F|nr:DUF2141 domain-containing protein [Geminicoccus harenae]
MAMLGGKKVPDWTATHPARLVAVISLALAPLPVAAGELRVTIEGIRSSDGTVMIGLYDSPASFARAVEASAGEGFLVDPQRFAAVALRANAAMRSAVVFSNLDPGRYAVIAFHDENGNTKLDKNFMGVPIEPYGFSNNVQGFLGPPPFDDAAMALEDNNQAIHIAMVYHKEDK